MAGFLDELVLRWHLGLDLEHEDYLQSRGASDEQIEGICVGSVSGKFEDRSPGDRGHFARWSHGLARLHGHIAFPLHDQLGEVAGVLTRDVAEKNYSKFTYSAARASAWFFGLPMALEAIWQTGVVWLVEGPFDWFPLQRVIPNTLATTSDTLSLEQAAFVRRYASVVVLATDLDEAGREGRERNRQRLHRRDVREVYYPKAKDPGKFWENVGERAFRRHFLEEAERISVPRV